MQNAMQTAMQNEQTAIQVLRCIAVFTHTETIVFCVGQTLEPSKLLRKI